LLSIIAKVAVLASSYRHFQLAKRPPSSSSSPLARNALIFAHRERKIADNVAETIQRGTAGFGKVARQEQWRYQSRDQKDALMLR